jgi:alpha-L-fucosidase
MKFGMRIHWGLSSTLGMELSWPIAEAAPEFQKTYLTQYQVFNPTEFDATEWAADAERWGFKYFNFTTKHHDGFCMYPTQTKMMAYRRAPGTSTSYHGRMPFVTEQVEMHYDIMDTMFKRDIVGELAAAFRKRNLAVGLYYSNADWSDPNFRWDPLNVHYKKGEPYGPETHPKEWKAFIDREREQVREICSNYGDIVEISFDGIWPESAWTNIISVVKMARQLQPGVLFRNRGLGAYGDYETPEHWVPTGPDDPRLIMKWEAIEQIGTDWAWSPQANYKPKDWILNTLIDCVAMGGNFMVGVSPMPNGKFPKETTDRLDWTGKWLKVNGEAIYASRPLSVQQADDRLKNAYQADRKNHIRYTRSKDGKTVYAIVTGWPGKSIALQTVRPVAGGKIVTLGFSDELQYALSDQQLIIQIPEKYQSESGRPCEFAWVFKVPVVEGAFGKGG